MTSFRDIPPGKFFRYLLFMFFIEALLLGLEPRNRLDWIVENILAIALIFYLWATVHWLPMSRISYTLIFIFLGVSEIGSHYTYSEVPMDKFVLWISGIDIHEDWGWTRNNFDRVVHFLYGLLLAYPIREFYLRVADARGFWGYFLPLDFTMSTSLVYELMEWGFFKAFGGDLGKVHLGMQGDAWDAQKDMLCASIGGLLAMIITAVWNLYYQKDFAREWSMSFRVKHKKPLGEEVWFRILRRKRKK